MQALLLLAPQVPLLFMGEEWGAAEPFLFFCDFHDELAAAVRDGRRREFARFPEFADEAARARIPDPNAAATFAASQARLVGARGDRAHADWLDWVRDAAAPAPRADRAAARAARSRASARRAGTRPRSAPAGGSADGARLSLVANLGAGAAERLRAARRRADFREPAGAGRGRSGRASCRGWSLAWFLAPSGPMAPMAEAAPPTVPRATYRLQFNAEFGFDAARRIVPYLAPLGISHLYASPLTMARPGSTHGYDVIDFNRLNPELGDEAGFDALVATLHAHGMGLMLDFVPNHMGVGSRQPLVAGRARVGPGEPVRRASSTSTGRRARAACATRSCCRCWATSTARCWRRASSGSEFDAGGRQLRRRATTTSRFPIAVRHYPAAAAGRGRTGSAAPAGALTELARRFAALGRGGDPRTRAVPGSGARPGRSRRSSRRLATDAAAASAIEAAIAACNGTPGRPRSFRTLHRLLEEQAYRLAYWRVASSEINYRRFFEINELAGAAHGAAGGVRGDPPSCCCA